MAVEVDGNALGYVAALVFGLPLAALFIGTWLGGVVAVAAAADVPPEVAGPTAGLFGLALACLMVTRCGESVMRVLKVTARRVRMVR